MSLPVVHITGTSGNTSRDQFRQACIDYGTTYDTVVTLPFQLDTSQATTMTSMFNGCSSLTQVPDMDTFQVTTMISMFSGCSSLTSVPDMDTSQVTTMANMFRGCSSLTSVPDMDTSQVGSVSNMFRDCVSLTDGNVRLIGRHPTVSTINMINDSGLTREPFYIRVTTDPPTFHDDYSITLPDIEGVTYTVDGVPGEGETVTVTATEATDDYWAIVGDTTWTHTWTAPALYWDGEPESLYWGGEVTEVYDGANLVWSAGPALIRSEPDYWYSLEDGAHYYNRGSRDEWLRFDSAYSQFANRTHHVWTAGAKPVIEVPDSWSGGFTLAGWFEITGGRDSTSYFFSRGGTGRTLYVMAPSGGTRVGVRFNPGNDLSAWSYTPEGSVPQGWFHLALTWEYVGGQNRTHIYIDGVLVQTMNWPFSHAQLEFGSEHRVSVVNTSASGHFPLDGNLDDFAMWSRTLSGSEVSAIARYGRVPTEILEPVPAYQESVHTATFTQNFTVPSWAREVDYIALGGGGGGRQGEGAIGGYGWGGGAGSYDSGTHPVGAGTLAVIVGGGGRGTAQGGAGTNHPGAVTYIQNWLSAGGSTSIASAAGGSRGSGNAAASSANATGGSPGNRSHAGMTIVGGVGGPPDEAGSPPGSGGGGGSGGLFGNFNHGQPGGRGQVHFRFRNAPRP